MMAPLCAVHTAASLDEAYGGPARSVPRLVEALRARGVEGTLLALTGGTALPMVAPAFRGRIEAAVQGRGPCVIHDHCLWRPSHRAAAAVARERGLPFVVSTRGMLNPWAMRHKRWRKHVAWFLYQRRALERAVLLASTTEEAEHLVALRLGRPVAVIPNGIDADAAVPRAERPSARLHRALFVGRLYPVKGIDLLLRAWAAVRPAGWLLEIAGPDEAGHRSELEALAATLGVRHVTFVGPLTEAAKWVALAGADLVVVPSRSESFGLVVGEALAAAVPVLTTVAVPWPSMETAEAGWRVPVTVEGLAAGLQRATALDDGQRSAMGARGQALVRAQYAWPAIAARIEAVYRFLLDGGAPPPDLTLP